MKTWSSDIVLDIPSMIGYLYLWFYLGQSFNLNGEIFCLIKSKIVAKLNVKQPAQLHHLSGQFKSKDLRIRRKHQPRVFLEKLIGKLGLIVTKNPNGDTSAISSRNPGRKSSLHQQRYWYEGILGWRNSALQALFCRKWVARDKINFYSGWVYLGRQTPENLNTTESTGAVSLNTDIVWYLVCDRQ